MLCMFVWSWARPQDLILKNADSNVNELIRNELVSTLNGNVTFLYDDMTILSDNAQWWRDQGLVTFTNNVQLSRERTHQMLKCRSMRLIKKEDLLTADGSLEFNDSIEHLRLTAQRGLYYTNERRLKVEGQPRFFQYDSAAAETLTIVGETMTYIDSLKSIFVDKNVMISRGKFVSHSAHAIYRTDSSLAFLRVKPRILYETDSIEGDSIDCFFREQELRGLRVMGNAHVSYHDMATDTSIANVFGDSLYLAFSDSGSLDSVWAYRNVRSTYTLQNDTTEVNRAMGKIMLLTFKEGKNLDQIKIWGNARTIYFINEKSSHGRNEASGDSIRINFEQSVVSTLDLSGSVRGTYYQSSEPSQKSVKGQKTP